MFWKKKKYFDNQLGNLKYSQGYWSFRTKLNQFGECSIDVSGSQHGPHIKSLNQTKLIITNIILIIEDAKTFIDMNKLQDFKGRGHLVFDGFSSHEEVGNFDLQFGLSNSDDATIVVHFKENKPFKISLAD